MQKGFISVQCILRHLSVRSADRSRWAPFFVYSLLSTWSTQGRRGAGDRLSHAARLLESAQQWNNENLGKLVSDIAAIVVRITLPYPPKPIVVDNVHKADYSVVKFCNFQPLGLSSAIYLRRWGRLEV